MQRYLVASGSLFVCTGAMRVLRLPATTRWLSSARGAQQMQHLTTLLDDRLHVRDDYKNKRCVTSDTSLSIAPDHSFVQHAGRRCAVPRHSALLRIYSISDSPTYRRLYLYSAQTYQERCRENPMHAFVSDLSGALITTRKQLKAPQTVKRASGQYHCLIAHALHSS